MEVASLRAQFESVAPKFGYYDDMFQKNDPWKQTVETMLTTQGNEQIAQQVKLQAVSVKQEETIAGLQTLYHKADVSLKDINVKLRDWSTNHPPGPGGERKEKWFLTRPTDLVPGAFSDK